MFAVDASVVLKSFLSEAGTDDAVRLLDRKPMLIAPAFVLVEALNVVWKQLRRGNVTRAQGREIEAALPRYFDELVPTERLSARALDLAIELDHPVYDCLYLACALGEGCRLISADQRFLAKALSGGYAASVVDLSAAATLPN